MRQREGGNMPKRPRPNVRIHPLDDFIREAAGKPDEPTPTPIDGWVYAVVILLSAIVALGVFGIVIAVVNR
ncbi:MAG: hypothetical protein KGI71_06415 [Patescibacteria group bacterium]|nr:hypothetical protein [Patescibacteria group bacterium]